MTSGEKAGITRHSSLVTILVGVLLMLGLPLVLEAQRLPYPLHILIMICL